MAELGFLRTTETWRLRHRYFPSKAGGKPAWLALEGFPLDITCFYCQEPLVFLLQIYAPGEEPNNFHRTLFVFMCIKEACLQKCDQINRCIRAFRCQLPRNNSFYSSDPPQEDISAQDPVIKSTLCCVCGCPGQKQCGACKMAYYCSKSHQVLHWRGGHKPECALANIDKNADTTASDAKATLSPVLFGFTEYQIDIENEDVQSHSEKDYDALMQDYEEFLQSSKPTMQHEPIPKNIREKACTEYGDKVFRHFKKRISDAPEQVLRYSKNAEPLFVSTKNVPVSIAPCEHCGAPRRFEFQIMPQIISFLKPEGLLAAGSLNVAKDIDFGTLLIYTCSKDCQTWRASNKVDTASNNEISSGSSPKENLSYFEEIVWKQSFSNS